MPTGSPQEELYSCIPAPATVSLRLLRAPGRVSWVHGRLSQRNSIVTRRSYFPSNADKGGAAKVSVTPGRVAENTDVRLVLPKVTGRVIRDDKNIPIDRPPSGLNNGQANVLMVGLRGATQSVRASGKVTPDGSFEIQNVRPGSYTAYAFATCANCDYSLGVLSSSPQVVVENTNVSGVLLNIP